MNTVPLGRKSDLEWLPLDKIIKNEKNPRRQGSFTEEELASLRASIKEHGILQPLVVQRYDDIYLLIEGERRWAVAKTLELKEVPAIVLDKRMDEHDQVVTMFNIHTQRKGWEMAEELAAIKELLERNGHLGEDAMAKELGISITTLHDRLQVLAMGPHVITKIAKGELDYSSALRADQIAKSLARKRPALVEKLGGEQAVEKKLLDKARTRKRGISQELVAARRDLSDPQAMPDELVEKYVAEPTRTLREVRQQKPSLEERRQVESFSKELKRMASQIAKFNVDLNATPNVRELRTALAMLINAASELESKVVTALVERKELADR